MKLIHDMKQPGMKAEGVAFVGVCTAMAPLPRTQFILVAGDMESLRAAYSLIGVCLPPMDESYVKPVLIFADGEKQP